GTARLSSRYFDTADRSLLRHRVTLRSRSGDADTGWQLKLPAGRGRTEVRLPSDAGHDQVPDELAALVLGLTAGQPLGLVAILDTVRSFTRIWVGTELLAELADDQVTASVPGSSAAVVQWREVEVELGAAGTEQVLAEIGQLLVQAGARPSASPSKLGHALGSPPGRLAPERYAGRLGGLLWDYLDEQTAVLAAGDLALRRGQQPIHDTRVASRRYRSALRVFADLFEPDRAAALDVELAWFAELLGAVRDGGVMRALLADTMAQLPPELVFGPVAELIEDHLRAEQAAALDRLLAAMSGSRYLALRAELARWHREPPFTERARRPVGKADGYLRAVQQTLRRRLRRAADGSDDRRLHQARKAAKRARYAAEVAEPALGKPARRQRKRAKRLQTELGLHQDAVTAAAAVRELALTVDGPSAFTLGVLHERLH
ncbi:MAG TPA: CYTH and CHAD domain-containing protein, partial [Jatrophihabitans sp.]|nr:CYTH and CHAD domain-containing protein [Jatrophihabitans sp.]